MAIVRLMSAISLMKMPHQKEGMETMGVHKEALK